MVVSKMSRYFTSISLLILLANQVLTDETTTGKGPSSMVEEEHHGFVTELKQLLTDAVQEYQDDIDSKIKEIQDLIETADEKGTEYLKNKYERTRVHIRSYQAPNECLESADNMLLETQQKQGFFSCQELKDVAKDVVDIGMEVGRLGVNLLLSADDLLNGFTRCLGWNFIQCTIKWVYTIFKDIITTFSNLRSFTSNVTDLVNDIKKKITYCYHEGDDQHHNNTLKVLKHIHECSINYIQK